MFQVMFMTIALALAHLQASTPAGLRAGTVLAAVPAIRSDEQRDALG